MISKIVLALSWLAVVVAALLTALWIGIVAKGNEVWAAFAFGMLAASAGIGVLLLALIPAGVVYFRTRQSKDLMIFALAGISFVVVLVEALLLNFVLPMRGE
jgi:branched-subunit amino acid transport protein